MRKIFFLCVLCALCSKSLHAQITTVTATITDPSGIPYASATVKAQLVLAGASVTGQPTVTNNSSAACKQAGFGNAPCQIPFQGTYGPFTLDSSGNFPGGGVNLQDNTQVTPSGTQWLFSITISPGVAPPLGTGPQACGAAITISGASQSVSATLSATCPKLATAVTGTVTSFSAGNLSPLFTTAVATPTSTPALSFTLSSFSANSVLGNCTGAGAPPTNCALTGAMIPPINLASAVNGGVTGNLPVTNLNGGSGASATNAWCGNGTWCNPVPSASVGKFSTTTLSANVTVTTTATTITSLAVTMPASGCPCRADVRYSLYLDFPNTNNTAATFWVSDGTVTFAGLQTGESNASTGARTSASLAGYSTVTYSNGANITFTLLGQYTTSSSFLVEAAPQTGSGPNSTFQVAIFSSN